MSDLPDWARDPDHLEELIVHCLKERDMRGVVEALKLLALAAPHRASVIHEALQLGIELRRALPCSQ